MENNKIQEVLTNQINLEIYSAYLYLSMAAYFDNLNLKGFAHWMKLQVQEETSHAMKIYDYLYDRRWQVKLTSIAAPPSVWDSPLSAMESAFAHEQTVTYKINSIMELAINLKDYATQSLLKWFVDEQVEEESSIDTIIQKLKLIEVDPKMILMLDAELGRCKKE